MATRCSICWPDDGPPPNFWCRSSAPHIPSRKDCLINQLSPLINDQKYLTSLTVTELRQLFRRLVRGEKHPKDPTVGLSNAKKDYLIALCKKHNLSTCGAKGDLALRVREHWVEQCSIVAKADNELTGRSEVSDSGRSSSWSVVTGEEPQPKAVDTSILRNLVSKISAAAADLAKLVDGKD